MSLLAATTVAALLIANPSATDLDRLAANGGFLIGNAHRCGIESSRVVHGGQIVHELIAAAAQDAKEEEEANGRFAAFFLVSAFPDPKKEKLIASCDKVASEFGDLEKHAPAEPAVGGGTSAHIDLGDGE